MMTATAKIPMKPKAMFMILSMVSGKERSDNPVPATSGEAKPWARAELKVKNAKCKVISAEMMKKPKRAKLFTLNFLLLTFFKTSIGFMFQDLCFTIHDEYYTTNH